MVLSERTQFLLLSALGSRECRDEVLKAIEDIIKTEVGAQIQVDELIEDQEISKLPVHEYIPGEMHGEAEYVLKTASEGINVLAQKVEQLVEKTELTTTSNILSSKIDQKAEQEDLIKNIGILSEQINQKLDKNEFIETSSIFQQEIGRSPSREEFTDSINILSSKIDKLTDALLALAGKLDDEDVTDLDTDYNDVVQSNL